MATKHVTDASFQADVLAAEGPVLVDFWAEWCGPCHAVSPALEQLAEEMGGEVSIVKLNIDENPSTPAKYAVRSIPTMILFKDGVAAATQVGSAPKSHLKAFIEAAIRNG
jgi:thioredoxin 1